MPLTIFAIDSLHKTYKKNEMAQSLYVYNKGVKSLFIYTNNEYDNMPEYFKNQFGNYGQYVSYQNTQNNILKNAVKVKIEEMQSDLDTDTMYTVEEKSQYNEDMEKVKPNGI